MAKVAQFFFRGILVVLPLTSTISLFVVVVRWVDRLVALDVPGLGLLIVVGAVTGVGMLASFFLTRRIFLWIEKLMGRLPLLSILYGAARDLVGAFVGDKRKFDKPVLVLLNKSDEVYKIGFVTDSNLASFDLEDYVSVYLPHSYNFSGNHFVVPSRNIRPLNISGTDAMRYVVSGGVSAGQETATPQ